MCETGGADELRRIRATASACVDPLSRAILARRAIEAEIDEARAWSVAGDPSMKLTADMARRLTFASIEIGSILEGIANGRPC